MTPTKFSATQGISRRSGRLKTGLSAQGRQWYSYPSSAHRCPTASAFGEPFNSIGAISLPSASWKTSTTVSGLTVPPAVSTSCRIFFSRRPSRLSPQTSMLAPGSRTQSCSSSVPGPCGPSDLFFQVRGPGLIFYFCCKKCVASVFAKQCVFDVLGLNSIVVAVEIVSATNIASKRV